MLNANLKDADDVVVSLAGSTVRFHMCLVGSDAAGVDGAASVIGDGSGGRFVITGQRLTRPQWELMRASLKLPFQITRLKHSQTTVSSPSRSLTIWHDYV